VRYTDDFVIRFETKEDAKRVMDWLGKRLGHFGLTLHPDKTRSASLRRFIGSVYDWCRRYRHLSVSAQHKALKRRGYSTAAFPMRANRIGQHRPC
jgi:hypothetical protein